MTTSTAPTGNHAVARRTPAFLFAALLLGATLCLSPVWIHAHDQPATSPNPAAAAQPVPRQVLVLMSASGLDVKRAEALRTTTLEALRTEPNAIGVSEEDIAAQLPSTLRTGKSIEQQGALVGVTTVVRLAATWRNGAYTLTLSRGGATYEASVRPVFSADALAGDAAAKQWLKNTVPRLLTIPDDLTAPIKLFVGLEGVADAARRQRLNRYLTDQAESCRTGTDAMSFDDITAKLPKDERGDAAGCMLETCQIPLAFSFGAHDLLLLTIKPVAGTKQQAATLTYRRGGSLVVAEVSRRVGAKDTTKLFQTIDFLVKEILPVREPR